MSGTGNVKIDELRIYEQDTNDDNNSITPGNTYYSHFASSAFPRQGEPRGAEMTHSPFLLPHECGGGKGGLRIERHVLVEVTHHFSPRPSTYDDWSENWERTTGDEEWPNGQVVFPGRNGAKGSTQMQERRTQVLMLCRCGISPAGNSRCSRDRHTVSL